MAKFNGMVQLEVLPSNKAMYVKAKLSKLVIPVKVPDEVWTLHDIAYIIVSVNRG